MVKLEPISCLLLEPNENASSMSSESPGPEMALFVSTPSVWQL